MAIWHPIKMELVLPLRHWDAVHSRTGTGGSVSFGWEALAISLLKIGKTWQNPKRKCHLNQPLIFRGLLLLVSGSVVLGHFSEFDDYWNSLEEIVIGQPA